MVPYRTRLTGWLISCAKAFSKKTRLAENEGFGVTRRTPRHFYDVQACAKRQSRAASSIACASRAGLLKNISWLPLHSTSRNSPNRSDNRGCHGMLCGRAMSGSLSG